MVYIDPRFIGEITLALAGLISLIIAILSIRSYLIIRSWKFLLLAASFLLLALPRLMLWTSVAGVYHIESTNITNPLTVAFILLSFGSWIAFAMLAFIYYQERVETGVRITALLWSIGGILIIVQGLILLDIIGGGHILIGHPAVQDSLGMLSLGSLVISNVLIVAIVISLVVYYGRKRSAGTLLALNGFSLILIAQTLTLLFLNEGAIGTVYDMSRGWLIAFTGGVSLIGFLAFLYAILRLKVSNGRRRTQEPL